MRMESSMRALLALVVRRFRKDCRDGVRGMAEWGQGRVDGIAISIVYISPPLPWQTSEQALRIANRVDREFGRRF